MDEFKAREGYLGTDIAAEYDRKRFRSLKGRSTDWLEKRAIVKAVRLAGCADGAEVLDLPCGTGRLSILFAEEGYRVTAGDISRAMLDIAEAKTASFDISERLDFQVMDAERLPFPDERFDAVVSLRLLGHVPPRIRMNMLKEFGRVSKGPVVVAYYHKHCLRGVLRKKERGLRGDPWYPASLKEMDEELVSLGFRPVKHLPLALGISETVVVLARKN
ncbi:MAG: class I SAM-dependent methyltransferase [Candidatus Aquicultorales bacterium]